MAPRSTRSSLHLCSNCHQCTAAGASARILEYPVAVLYGDAALSTRRMGAILYFPAQSGAVRVLNHAFTVEVPAPSLAKLSPTGEVEHSINGFEALWVLKACEHWRDLVRNHLLLIFCDNYAAVRGLVRGYSASAPVCKIVGSIWQEWIENQVVSWVEWVHTKSNPADALTRPGWMEALRCMGLHLEELTWNSAVLDTFQ